MSTAPRRVLVRNDRHGTSTRLQYRPGQPIPATSILRVADALCPDPQCRCGGELCETGPQCFYATVRERGGEARLLLYPV